MTQNVEKQPAKSVEAKSVHAESVETIDVEPSWGERLLSVEHWLRFVFMVLFAIIVSIAGYVMMALVLLQFLLSLITGEANDNLREFGGRLSQYIYQILRFLTYNSQDKPFPFADWPDAEKEN